MNKCYAKLIGGLGNQLFILAASYAYSRECCKDLVIDTEQWHANQGSNPWDYSDTIFKNFNYVYREGDNVQRIIEKDFNYHELPNKLGDVSLHGYFQSLKYFENYQYDFYDLLNLPDVDTTFVKPKNVAFHIRRGDYLLFPDIHYVCDTQWFENRFRQFEGYQINVFTDSPEHVLQEFEDFDFNLIQTSSELNDLTLMSKHSNIVCSNSTFSWWASRLGDMERVIVPSIWFADNQNTPDIYANNMEKCD